MQKQKAFGSGKQQQLVYREKLQITPNQISHKSKIDELFDSAGKSTCDNSTGLRKKGVSAHEDVEVDAFDVDEIDCSVDCSSNHDNAGLKGKKGSESQTSSRNGSLSRSTASEERESSSNRTLSDQQHSDLDVSSEDLTDAGHELIKQDKFSSPKSNVEEPVSIQMKKQSSEDSPLKKLKGLDAF